MISKWIMSFLILTLALSSAHSQWWNPMSPKDYNDCIIKNLKDGMGEDAVTALKFACYEKYPPQLTAQEKREESLKKQKLAKCGIEEDHARFHWFINLNERKPATLNKILKSLDVEEFNPYSNYAKIHNKSGFSISGIMIGLTKAQNCPTDLDAFDAIAYCKSYSTEFGVIASMSYGKFSCTEIPQKAKKLGICVVGYSPQYNQYDDSLIKHKEYVGLCTK